jgi:hypothetical protein
MKPNTSRMYGVPVLVTGTILVVMLAAPSAQRGRRGGADANQGVPTATNTILEHPDVYYGKQVTISAGVAQVLSKTAFLIDQWKAVGPQEVAPIGKPILVIAPYLTASLSQKSYLMVRGELVKLDPAAIARVAADYKLDLAPEIGAHYQGLPVLVATSVINSTSVELARKPLPPPSPEEVSLDAAMKTIAPAFAALRTAVQDSKADVITENVAKLKPAFIRAETVWDDLGVSSAAELAREAQARTASIEGAAAVGNWDAVKASAGALNQLCTNCHGVYRERLEDGSFRIKPGLF